MIGRVGCGKSSLFAAMTAEMERLQGQVCQYQTSTVAPGVTHMHPGGGRVQSKKFSDNLKKKIISASLQAKSVRNIRFS